MSTPMFHGQKISGMAQISTAETSLTAPTEGSLGLLYSVPTLTESTNSIKSQTVEYIWAFATATTTTGNLFFYIEDASDSFYLAEGMNVSSVTVAAGTLPWSGVLSPSNLVLTPGQKLWVGTLNAESFNVFSTGGSYYN